MTNPRRSWENSKQCVIWMLFAASPAALQERTLSASSGHLPKPWGWDPLSQHRACGASGARSWKTFNSSLLLWTSSSVLTPVALCKRMLFVLPKYSTPVVASLLKSLSHQPQATFWRPYSTATGDSCPFPQLACSTTATATSSSIRTHLSGKRGSLWSSTATLVNKWLALQDG